MADTSSETIVAHTKAHSAWYGIPEKVITDNGPQFWAQVYEEFASQWGFSHVTSSPYHSKGNGRAEATVRIAKSMLKKVTQDNLDIKISKLPIVNRKTKRRQHADIPSSLNMHYDEWNTYVATYSTTLKFICLRMGKYLDWWNLVCMVTM